MKEELNEILESSYDGIHIVDGKGISLYYNSACERIEKINKTDVLAKNVKELVDRGLYNKSISLEVLEKKTTITSLQNINGKEVIVTSTPIFKNGEVIRVVSNTRDITELNALKRELFEKEKLANKYHFQLELLKLEQLKTENIIAQSNTMKSIISLAKHIADVDSTVLINGESGVGKGVLSKFIHNNSKRKKGPFIKIDCGAIPENLLESELFGYEKGAFTGSNKEGKIGLVELADGGTLFMDEIGEMPLSLQVKILRMMQDREIIKVGGKETIPINTRIIAATNKDLEKMIKEKKFREDLFYRLNVIPITIPPLRERKEDIQPLILKTIKKINQKYHLTKKINIEAMDCLINYDWPGNVRELENIIERLLIIAKDEIIEIENLPNKIRNSKIQKQNILEVENLLNFRDTMDICEKQLLMNVMKKSVSIIEMSQTLKLDLSTVRRKLKKHGIKKSF